MAVIEAEEANYLFRVIAYNTWPSSLNAGTIPVQIQEVEMRNLSVLSIFAAYVLSAAKAQQPQIHFGLWEGTIVQRSSVSAYTASILRQKGQKVPSSYTQSYRVCMNQAKWNQAKAAASVPPPGCLVLHNANGPKSMSLSVKCKLEDGTSVLIGAEIAWEAGTTAKATNRMETFYPGTTGEVSVETKIDSHFVSSSCGPLTPGASEPLHP